MAFNYEKYVDIISDKIDDYGGTVNYYKNIDGAKDSITNTITYSKIAIPIKALVTDYSQLVIDDAIVKVGDKQVIIKSTIGEPKLNDNIGINGIKYKIIAVKEIIPNAVDIMLYKLQTRSYAVAEAPIDLLTSKIGDLDPGSLVVDPLGFSQEFEWMVLEHDHFESGVTSLITKDICAAGYFDGGAAVGYYPDTPWTLCWLRHYLRGDFITNYISTGIQELMREVSIETQSNTSDDTIIVLSNEEVFDVVVGSSSGSYIDYFASNALRIALWYDDQLAYNWWLRDVHSWTPPNGAIRVVSTTGTQSAKSDGSVGGIRPVIFISEGQKVNLSGDGTFYYFSY